ncbi:hypothetical protein MLD38_004649 [Melastoma candidum]|uniref:Uncharacterized protein n=1 Tax=Melastoma candidum TaxID=119954 RepID=A0ACB9S688_9MYRT|nr:hypothetical protein MLD38_004649 [Melastoma candidum]
MPHIYLVVKACLLCYFWTLLNESKGDSQVRHCDVHHLNCLVAPLTLYLQLDCDHSVGPPWDAVCSIAYTFSAGMFKMDSVKAGTPYGAGVYAGDGSRHASDTELALAEH